MQGPSWLFWVIGVLALLFGAFSVFDFYMFATKNSAYLQDYPPEMAAWINDFPIWRKALWMLTVAAGLVGPVLLLTRSSLAPAIMWTGVASMIVGFVAHDLLLANGLEMYGTAGLIASTILVGISAGFAGYASRAKSLGLLRAPA